MRVLLLASTILFVETAASQQLPDILFHQPGAPGAGWQGFTDVAFLVNALLALTLATVLGAAIAYHPKHGQAADTLEEIEAPKIYILYSVIGAIIGIMVVKYGLVVGFVLFGIGGLIRVRTAMRSVRLTGQLIFVTLIGLSCGLDLPHVAVLATAFGFTLIYMLDVRMTYRIVIRALAPDHIAPAAAAYRALLEQQGCTIMSEKKNPRKKRINFIFQKPGSVTRGQLEDMLETEIDPALRGSVDWEVD